MPSISEQTIAGFMGLSMRKKPLFAQFLSDHGRVMTVSPEHADNPFMGELKQCYRNSANAVLYDFSNSLYYCEGYAATKALGFPLEHAWLCDAHGRVIDPTWREAGIDYFGAVFSVDFLRDHLLHTKHYGVLCNLHLLPPELRGYGECLAYLESGIVELDFENANDARL